MWEDLALDVPFSANFDEAPGRADTFSGELRSYEPRDSTESGEPPSLRTRQQPLPDLFADDDIALNISDIVATGKELFMGKKFLEERPCFKSRSRKRSLGKKRSGYE